MSTLCDAFPENMMSLYSEHDDNFDRTMAAVHGHLLRLRRIVHKARLRIQLPSVTGHPESDSGVADPRRFLGSASWYPFISINVSFLVNQRVFLSLHHFSPALESAAPDGGCKLESRIN